ncbi:hypothetical protein BGZ52_005546, partial [Haplosporangium bisporale]
MQPDANNAKETMLSSSEWGPESNKEMIDEIYNYPVKAGAESKGNAKIQAAAEPPVAEVYTSTAKPRAPLTEEEWATMDKPKVLIVGAGIGGLFLGNLLYKAEIPFLIFDRAHEVKNL